MDMTSTATTNPVQLSRVEAGHYTHPAGHSVTREENEGSDYGPTWQLEFPNGDWVSCSTLGEARGYIADDVR